MVETEGAAVEEVKEVANQDKIDLAFLKEVSCEKLGAEEKVVKYNINEGKGSLPNYDSVIYFTQEIRFKDGSLMDPSNAVVSDKVVSKFTIGKPLELSISKGGDSGDRVLKMKLYWKCFDLIFKTVKRGEISWNEITKPYHEIENLPVKPPQLETDEDPLDVIYVKITIQKINHVIKKNFPTRLGFSEKIKEIGKEYLTFPNVTMEEYGWALDLYTTGICDLESFPPKVLEKFTPEQMEQRKENLRVFSANSSLVALKLEKWELAKTNAERNIEQNPNDLKALYRCGVASYKMKLFDKAYTCLSKCLKKEPGNPAFQTYTKFLQEHKGKMAKKKNKFYEEYEKELTRIEDEKRATGWIPEDELRRKQREEQEQYEEVYGEMKMEQTEKGMVMRREKIKRKKAKKD